MHRESYDQGVIYFRCYQLLLLLLSVAPTSSKIPGKNVLIYISPTLTRQRFISLQHLVENSEMD